MLTAETNELLVSRRDLVHANRDETDGSGVFPIVLALCSQCKAEYKTGWLEPLHYHFPFLLLLDEASARLHLDAVTSRHCREYGIYELRRMGIGGVRPNGDRRTDIPSVHIADRIAEIEDVV